MAGRSAKRADKAAEDGESILSEPAVRSQSLIQNFPLPLPFSHPLAARLSAVRHWAPKDKSEMCPYNAAAMSSPPL